MISGESMMCFLHQSLPEKLAVFFFIIIIEA